jgi:hypothetical protein
MAEGSGIFGTRHIKDAPLTKLTKKNEVFLWSEDCERSFQELNHR